MKEKKGKQTRLQAQLLGRVERLLGRESRVNPYPESSELWTSFREGWLRTLDNPLSHELRSRGL
jgi:hypothetical protein